jgi:uncharacterized protein YecE (DUF72 family)
MKVHVGQAKVVGPISRYAGRFNFLELGAEQGRCPRPAVLKCWRQEVPKGFAFSVRLGRAVGAFDSGAEACIVFGLEVAEALDARWVLLQTPATLGPSQRNRERLRRLFERLLQTGRHVAWDPRGIWDEAEVLPLISEVNVQWARDASRYEMVEEPLAYARIPALGTASRVGLGLAERAGENLRGFTEVYVVIEGEGAGRAAQIIREVVNQPAVGDGDETLPADGVEELSMQSARASAGFERTVSDTDDSESGDPGDEELDDEELDDEELDDEELDDEELDDEDNTYPANGEHVEKKPEIIEDDDLPWGPGAKGKRSR